MRALVVTGPDTFSVEKMEDPVAGYREILARVRAVAICGTDAHLLRGDYPGFWPPGYPFTPGHEWAGEIVGLGPEAEVLGWVVGDRVAACGVLDDHTAPPGFAHDAEGTLLHGVARDVVPGTCHVNPSLCRAPCRGLVVNTVVVDDSAAGAHLNAVAEVPGASTALNDRSGR